ncbi:MAG: Prolipoprotein diacylglyceryl transferase [Parcubacteria group bacterium GW2011_GWC2_45_7]|nr:MAG: Prolipoprotein diacylglyceryl transferase [Parcubacteria group bacterium GW2011_GWC2_45_7]KKU72913.1 MAG: Prolipoprotein diacylglyceryl transferase [Parcubacteria group bacterium GW2011_GWA2_47_26]HBO99881.1 hypothetical protein [Candidatus Uhrbacteria bacterium]
MIPYFYVSTFHLGPLALQTWGLVVSIGAAVGIFFAHKRAKRFGLDPNPILDWSFWALISAFVGARFFHVFFYDWSYYGSNPSDIIKFWQGGMSSFGGFSGALIASFIYGWTLIRKKQVSWEKILRYADIIMYWFPLGWGIGRIGCFLTHMHPGRLSSLPIAVAYPGGSRLDMGLTESFFALLIFGLFVILSRRKYWHGFYLVMFLIIYGAGRFMLDFNRATDLVMSDARYLGLTPAQIGSLTFVIGGLYLWSLFRKPAVVGLAKT